MYDLPYTQANLPWLIPLLLESARTLIENPFELLEHEYPQRVSKNSPSPLNTDSFSSSHVKSSTTFGDPLPNLNLQKYYPVPHLPKFAHKDRYYLKDDSRALKLSGFYVPNGSFENYVHCASRIFLRPCLSNSPGGHSLSQATEWKKFDIQLRKFLSPITSKLTKLDIAKRCSITEEWINTKGRAPIS